MAEIEDYMSAGHPGIHPWLDDVKATFFEIAEKAESQDEYWLAIQQQREMFGLMQIMAEKRFVRRMRARHGTGRPKG